MAADYSTVVGELAAALKRIGLEPVLVGGMALVVLGSRRVTRDFDFVVGSPGDGLEPFLDVMYSRGLELVTRFTDAGEVAATLSSKRVAATRLKIDRPVSASFYERVTGLRIDLLFDFPIPARTLLRDAVRVRLGGERVPVASATRLLELKRLAAAARDAPGDAEDIRFLQQHLSDPRV